MISTSACDQGFLLSLYIHEPACSSTNDSEKRQAANPDRDKRTGKIINRAIQCLQFSREITTHIPQTPTARQNEFEAVAAIPHESEIFISKEDQSNNEPFISNDQNLTNQEIIKKFIEKLPAFTRTKTRQDILQTMLQIDEQRINIGNFLKDFFASDDFRKNKEFQQEDPPKYQTNMRNYIVEFVRKFCISEQNKNPEIVKTEKGIASPQGGLALAKLLHICEFGIIINYGISINTFQCLKRRAQQFSNSTLKKPKTI